MEIVNTLWVEKHRPKFIGEMVLTDDYRSDFEIFIKNRDIPNLLFYGPAGSGKTAVAQILSSVNGILENVREDLLYINGSGKDTRGISFVESVIEPFLRVPPDERDNNKIVFIDEADNLTRDAMLSLKVIIEKYSSYGRFIFACNYVSKIDGAIASRTQPYEFKRMPIEYIINFSANVLNKENIVYTEEDLRYTCESFYPDIRRTINTLQKNSLTGELKIDRKAILTTERRIITAVLEIIEFLSNNQKSKIGPIISSLIQMLGEKDIEYKRVYEELFLRKEIFSTCKILINKYSNDHQNCLVPSMHFMSLIFEMVNAMDRYKELVGKK